MREGQLLGLPLDEVQAAKPLEIGAYGAWISAVQGPFHPSLRSLQAARRLYRAWPDMQHKDPGSIA